jgi:hypothetical protein
VLETVIACAARTGAAAGSRSIRLCLAILLRLAQLCPGHLLRDHSPSLLQEAAAARGRRVPRQVADGTCWSDLLRCLLHRPGLLRHLHRLKTVCHPHPIQGGAQYSAAMAPALGISPVAPSTSSVDLATSENMRPITRSQSGIVKPKVYTDGTVRWGMLASSSDEEPTSVQRALVIQSGLKP